MTQFSIAVFKGDALVRVVTLSGQDMRIGRHPENELALKDEGKSVSRFHAELRADRGGYVVVDLDSQNGTWVDGERVTRAALTPGHDVVVGPYRLAVRAGEFAPGELPPLSPANVTSNRSGSVPTIPSAQQRTRVVTPPVRRRGAAALLARPQAIAAALLVVILVVIGVMLWQARGRAAAPPAPGAPPVVSGGHW